MTEQQVERLNAFFVQVFNRILALEEQALGHTGCKDLSVRGLHVLEAVSVLTEQGRNTMSSIAEMLAISVGALTTSVNLLVRKGYLERQASFRDRRVTFVLLTDRGREAERLHREFHRELARSVGERLDEESLAVLMRSLEDLEHFFTGGDTARKGEEKQ